MYQVSEAQKRLIGKGMKFPNPISEYRGSTQVQEGIEKLNQSIHMILATPVGTRTGFRKFGSKLHTLTFEPNDFILADLLKLYAHEALSTWEPRINVRQIDVNYSNDSNYVNITIRYNVINSNVEGNYVYPFFRKV